jgi:hypothetical protein
MPAEPVTHFVFVDFENVNNIDLASLGGKPARVFLLIGETPKRPDWSLTQQIHRHASQVVLVEAGVSGRNALDLVLAYQLGQAAKEHPEAQFHIVSRDKDFDPLVTHLRSNGIKVSRHDAFAALPFVAKPSRTSQEAGPGSASDERLAKLIDRLKNKPKARPVRRKTLLSHINAFFGNQLSAAELEDIVAALIARKIIAIDAKDRVSY